MQAGQRSRCRSCDAPVVWGYTKEGRPCPLDPDTGLSHYLTCDDPERWSKKKTPRQELPGQLTLFPKESK